MIQKKLESFINGYLKANDLEIQNWHISSNKKQGFGDYSSNIALALSKQIGQNPMEIAEKIIASHDKARIPLHVLWPDSSPHRREKGDLLLGIVRPWKRYLRLASPDRNCLGLRQLF